MENHHDHHDHEILEMMALRRSLREREGELAYLRVMARARAKLRAGMGDGGSAG